VKELLLLTSTWDASRKANLLSVTFRSGLRQEVARCNVHLVVSRSAKALISAPDTTPSETTSDRWCCCHIITPKNTEAAAKS